MRIFEIGFLLINCLFTPNQNVNKELLISYISESKEKNVVKQVDSILSTGFYYVSISDNGFKRQIGGAAEYLFIDPSPILTIKDFKSLKLYSDKYTHQTGLGIIFTEKGSEIWSNATEKAIGKQVAFVFKNQLIVAPRITAQITVGFASISQRNNTKKELKKLKKAIEAEMK